MLITTNQQVTSTLTRKVTSMFLRHLVAWFTLKTQRYRLWKDERELLWINFRLSLAFTLIFSSGLLKVCRCLTACLDACYLGHPDGTCKPHNNVSKSDGFLISFYHNFAELLLFSIFRALEVQSYLFVYTYLLLDRVSKMHLNVAIKIPSYYLSQL